MSVPAPFKLPPSTRLAMLSLPPRVSVALLATVKAVLFGSTSAAAVASVPASSCVAPV